MKQMYAVVLGDDDGKSIDTRNILCLDNNIFLARINEERLNDRDVKCHICTVMVDIVRIGDDRED